MNSKVLKFQPKVKGGEAARNYITPMQRRLNEMGKSRKWLAEQTGLSVQQIGNYCAGRQRLNPDSITGYKLKKALGVSEDYLILGFSRH